MGGFCFWCGDGVWALRVLLLLLRSIALRVESCLKILMLCVPFVDNQEKDRPNVDKLLESLVIMKDFICLSACA